MSRRPPGPISDATATVEAVDPIDVSNAVAWLVSDVARYVTGSVITVEAGNINRR